MGLHHLPSTRFRERGTGLRSPLIMAILVNLLSMVVIAVVPTVAQQYVYIWYPRNADVGPSTTSPDVKLLGSILALVRTQDYTVRKGDTLDYIIRKLFLVSSTQQPHAYSLYLNRLYQLNPT